MILQQAILTLAPLHVARAYAFSASVDSHYTDIAHDSAGLIVYDGDSERTVYRDARVNHAFRAWHDDAHIRARAGFDLEGERATCAMQEKDLLRAFPSAPYCVIELLRAEVIGQAAHYLSTGNFIKDQLSWARHTLERKSFAALQALVGHG